MVKEALGPIVLAGERHHSPVRCLELLPDGRIISGGTDGKLVLASDDEGALDREIEFPSGLFSRNDSISKLILMQGLNRVVVLTGSGVFCFDLSDHQLVWRYSPDRVFAFLRSVPLDAVVTDEGVTIVSSSSGQMAWIGQNGGLLREFHDNDAPHTMALIRDQEEIVGTDGFAVHAWSATEMSRTRSHLFTERCFSIAELNPDDGYALRIMDGLAIVSDSHERGATIRVRPGSPKIEFEPETGTIFCIDDELLSLWTLDGEEIGWIEIGDSRPTSLCYDRVNKILAIGAADGSIFLENFESLRAKVQA